MPLSGRAGPSPQHYGAGNTVDSEDLAPHCSPPHRSPQLMASVTMQAEKDSSSLGGLDTRSLAMFQLIYRPHKMGSFFILFSFEGGGYGGRDADMGRLEAECNPGA